MMQKVKGPYRKHTNPWSSWFSFSGGLIVLMYGLISTSTQEKHEVGEVNLQLWTLVLA